MILEGDPHALERIVSAGKLKLESGHRVPEATPAAGGDQQHRGGDRRQLAADRLSAQASLLFERFGVNLLAVSRTGSG